MKTILIIFVLLSSIPLLNAQSNSLVFEDNFNNNSKNWNLVNNKDQSSSIKKGFFYMEDKNKTSDIINWNNLNFDANKDYTFETRIKITKGDVNAFSGLIIYASDFDNKYLFLISANGYYQVSSTSNGIMKNDDWITSNYINGMNNFNTLKIEKKGNKLFYYINNTLVETGSFQGSFGNYFGLFLSTSSKVQADYLKIYESMPSNKTDKYADNDKYDKTGKHDNTDKYADYDKYDKTGKHENSDKYDKTGKYGKYGNSNNTNNYSSNTQNKTINIVDNPITTPKENLGDGINTDFSELHPIISYDGKSMYFVREDEDKETSNIWVSHFDGTKWGKATSLGKPINTNDFNSMISISPDNNKIFLVGTYDKNTNSVFQGFSYSTKNKKGDWSYPVNITVDNYDNIGTYSSFTYSSDFQVLILDIEYPNDSYGENDLYVSFRQSDGTYSTPKNMGHILNTSGDEGTPFLAADGKTLYFSSDGHPGYGSSDIFVSQRLDDTWTNWTEPLNLGPAINSDKWDAYFTVDASGKYAYLVSSADDGYGEEDIFRVQLQDELQPDPVVLIYGKVYDKNTNLPLSSNILFDNFDTNVEIDAAVSDSSTGEYKIILPCGVNYGFFAKKDGYFAASDNIDLSNTTEYTEIERDLYLVPIQQQNNNSNNNATGTDDKIELNNIFFARGKAQLLSSSYPELNRLVQMMNNNPNLEIEIQGYTNNVGDKQALIDLSKQRTDVVKSYIVNKGISASRITTKGFGPDNPIADNNTATGRNKNQRVEFVITKQ